MAIDYDQGKRLPCMSIVYIPNLIVSRYSALDEDFNFLSTALTLMVSIDLH